MSIKPIPPAQSDAEAILPLLIEYVDKIKSHIADLKAIQAEARVARSKGLDAQRLLQGDFEAARWFLSRLKRPLNDLIRQSSQLLEHGKTTVATGLELGLRVAELEALTRRAERIGGEGLKVTGNGKNGSA